MATEEKYSQWKDGDGLCQLCQEGVENEEHILFFCKALENVRDREIKVLREKGVGKQVNQIMIIALGLHKSESSLELSRKAIRILCEWEKQKSRLSRDMND